MGAKVIAFVNFKGGVGKAANVVNIGAGLAKYHGKRVLIVDLDAQSKAGILAYTAGATVSLELSLNATGFGNVITNRVDASIKGGATVSAAKALDQSAADRSTVRSIGVSAAGNSRSPSVLAARRRLSEP